MSHRFGSPCCPSISFVGFLFVFVLGLTCVYCADLVDTGTVNQSNLVESSDIPGLKIVEGFQADLIWNVSQEQGSWVALAVDSQGRLITSDQYGKLYRISLPAIDATDEKPSVEPINLNIGFAHGLLYAFDSLYVVAHAANRMPAGLYRLQDTNGDDQFDSVKLLREFDGGGEHGPHAVILSPDQKSLYICGGNHTRIPNPETSLVPRLWQEDQVMPRLWDAGGHAVGIMAPGGWVCKTDPAGESFELISIGFRNQFDIAFNSAGELFTYDADMEWDIGAPWYRPTRICHITSGSEFGWRSGTGKWPDFYQDSLPAVVDIGLGSPTGIVFGYDTTFPQKYRDALYACDWSYGVIYAVHLAEQGSSYTATFERFCAAPALPVADIVANPHDGCLYFVTGGRRMQSALYRIRATLPNENVQTQLPVLTNAMQQRRELETWHRPNAAVDYSKVWKALQADDDRHLRFAARTVLEHQPIAGWIELEHTHSANTKIELATAVARLNETSRLDTMLELLGNIEWNELREQQKLELLRAYGLLLIRLDHGGVRVKKAINQRFGRFYPSHAPFIDQELSRLLSATVPNDFVATTVQLLTAAPTQEEAIHYALCLSHVEEGWTPALRQTYFQWFFDAASARGGNSLIGFINNIRKEAIDRLDDVAKAELAELITKTPALVDPYAGLKARPLVKKWQVDEVLHAIQDEIEHADQENGEKMFSLAQCYACHRLRGAGGFVGPDLSPAGNRYSLRDLIQTIIEPDHEVSDQYAATKFLLTDGRIIVGRVVNLNAQQYMVQTDMINPAHLTSILVDDIEEIAVAETSMMPAGLLDNLTLEEIRDLIGYLKGQD
ncbi:MAG TPA: c-type cytochrome [Pirellulaceae bacterium]|nr:c-type cytochrome [Pirellulaceae bacterium]HMO91864.1 c-type cytochrome [Pirellulaceae bacterium]HMP69726.1 c-type cytochrome [Pirellulaceae bacterium]